MSIGHTVAGVDDSGGMARDSKLSQQRASISTDKRSLNNDSGPTSGDLEVDTEKALHPSEASLDPNVVNWDGPHDPANPLNWAKPTRLGQVVIISIITLVANLASTISAPGASLMMADFHSTSATIGTLTVTIYLFGFAIGPMVIAPLSELYGRLIIYHICNGLFFVFTIACGVSSNVGMLLAFRFLAGCAGSAPLTIGGGTVSDVIPQEKRGAAMALFAVGPLLGPVIGPVIGGFIAQGIGWRWTFWILGILSGSVSIIAWFLMRETYAVVILNRKAARLRKETGNLALTSITDSTLTPIALFKRSLIRPLKLLLLSPIVLALSLFSALVFGLTFLLFTTFPLVFEKQYGFSSGVTGLSYLGLAMGMIFGVVLFSALSDKILKKQAKGGEMKPEYRLPLMVYLMPVMPIGFFWYGWSAHERVHWIVPILGTLFIGIGSLFVIMPAQTYLVDAFGPYAASALAANTILRSLFGTFLPLAGPPMYKTLGLGWGNTLLGFLALSFAPIPWLFYRYGEQVRKRWVVKL